MRLRVHGLSARAFRAADAADILGNTDAPLLASVFAARLYFTGGCTVVLCWLVSA